jgi:hypothetical protein
MLWFDKLLNLTKFADNGLFEEFVGAANTFVDFQS